MLIKTPKFWSKVNFISCLLWPLSFIYRALTFLANLLRCPKKISKPIICIGNITMGGSGKTPVALAIGKLLQELGVDFVYLSRGYLAKEEKSGFVDNGISLAKDTGDEPLLLAGIAPTFVAKNRLNGAKEIVKSRPQTKVIVIDDGMQNNSIQKDFVILVIDGQIKFGNNFLFPAGPLREKITPGVAKSDLVIVIGKIDHELQATLACKKVVTAQIKASNAHEFVGKKLLAFCGLAHPEKFFSFLVNQGLEVVESKSFPDHYFYKDKDLEKLVKTAQNIGAKLVTTKKDWVKFSPYFKEKIKYLDIALIFDNKVLVAEELKNIL